MGLTQMLIKGKHPYKNKQELNELVGAKCEGSLNEDEVKEIVKYMYNQDDSEIIQHSLKAHLAKGAQTEAE